MTLRPALLLALLVGGLPASGSGQDPEPPAGDPGGSWNSERALELIRRGRERRARVVSDTALQGYRARATGHVFFLVDRGDTGERTLVKADQLALQVSWQSPGRVRQRIVGRRAERQLPTTIRYHLDHLTVVTDDFDDRITLGEGDEIRAVPHPLAARAERVYDFRVSDSLTISFPGPEPAVRVYEVEVRPRSMEEPGYLGSLFLDRRTAAVVRMAFTFTPASYVDPYLDHIRISLSNSRWRGRFWLPYRQEVEIRRELPQLDFPAGSVIQGRWKIGDYRFNPEFPEGFFRGPTVTTLPEAYLSRYTFDEGLYEPLEGGDLVPPPDVDDVRARALAMAGQRYLSGLRRLRLFLPSASSGLRYNRAEGLYLGGGLSFQPLASLSLKLHGGYAFGRDDVSASVRATGGDTHPTTGVHLYHEELRDLGPVPGASGVANTFSALVLDADYVDPYFASGVALEHRIGDDAGPRLEAVARWEEHRSGRTVVGGDVGGDGFRPVRPVEEGTLRSLETALVAGDEARGPGARLGVLVGRFEERGYAAFRGLLSWSRRWMEPDVELRSSLRAGAVGGDAPPQTLHLIGGRGTLPGYRYRSFVGDRYGLFRVEAQHQGGDGRQDRHVEAVEA